MRRLIFIGINREDTDMKTNVTFRHFNAHHQHLHDAAIDAADRFGKFYDHINTTNVEFINDAEKTVQFTVQVSGSTLVVTESTDEFHKSLALAEDKMVRQLRKHKTKTADH